MPLDTTTIPVTPLANIGAEITGVDASKPVSPALAAELNALLAKWGVLVLRGQTLTEDQHIAFSRNFGTLHIQTTQAEWNDPRYPELYVVGNLKDDQGRPKTVPYGGFAWHSDRCYEKQPALGSLLYGRICPPEGADTLFADMAAAYDALPQAMKDRIAPLWAIFSYNDYLMTNPARKPLTGPKVGETTNAHPVTRTHPVTGRKAIFINEFVSDIGGLTRAEAKELIAQLMDHCTQDRFVYGHKWAAGDLVMWDNRSTMHRATPYDQKHSRLMHRTTVLGDTPY
jgi:taurine dioxygenase